MNAKEITAAIIRNLTGTREANESITPPLYDLKNRIYLNSLEIYLMRTRSDSLRLDAPAHVYREMFVPYNAVRAGLKKQGFDPETIGLTDIWLFSGVIDTLIQNAEGVLEDNAVRFANDPQMYARSGVELGRALDKLKEIGFSAEVTEIQKLITLREKVAAKEHAPLYEYVALVNESLELRALAEKGQISSRQEDRLEAISTYIYRNHKALAHQLRELSSTELREKIIGGHSWYEFQKKVDAAMKRYETSTKKAKREAKEAVERAVEEEREKWRTVAKTECQHRYGHENYAANSDWNGDGHFYSGPDQMEWGIPPDDGDHGLLVLKSGEQRCLCHWHKLSDDRFIPRKYSTPQVA